MLISITNPSSRKKVFWHRIGQIKSDDINWSIIKWYLLTYTEVRKHFREWDTGT